MGSSPLTRGKLNNRDVFPYNLGLIPAHAGKTSRRACRSPQTWAHPRSRGENLLLVLPSGSIQGSSPLTRGKRVAPPGPLRGPGLIPAHAGKTVGARGGRVPRRAHPRSRGENVVLQEVPEADQGSSPLTRGKPVHVPGVRGAGRLIPAHAGKTSRQRSAGPRRGAHPRSRGENNRMSEAEQDRVGSSPLTRGKHGDHRRKEARRRLIPAHAGKTFFVIRGRRPVRAHPRSRGEN